jgi:hypothetical protein
VLVNPSSRGQTVVTYTIKPPIGIKSTNAFPLRNEHLESSCYLLPNGEESTVFQTGEILLGSLDILPYQSQNRIIGYYLEADFQQRKRSPLPEKFYIFVQDIDGKQLAKTYVLITDEQLTTDDIYAVHKRVILKT